MGDDPNPVVGVNLCNYKDDILYIVYYILRIVIFIVRQSSTVKHGGLIKSGRI